MFHVTAMVFFIIGQCEFYSFEAMFIEEKVIDDDINLNLIINN